MSKGRVLLSVLVYNGRSFVPRCLESAARISRADPSVDVLVIDDCSPEPGWSEEVRELCRSSNLLYYRSPRNLGISRSMNLAMRFGQKDGYEHVILANSDVVFPIDLCTQLSKAAASSSDIGSVTAWSNNVSIFSLPNSDPETYLEDQSTVDWISEHLHHEFGDEVLDIPVGVGFCMLIPTKAIDAVGVMDPVFGKGYCEEVDWCLRAAADGLRNVLSPAAFVYHMGGASSKSAGLIGVAETTVNSNEKIIDLRYPDYRHRVASFEAQSSMTDLRSRALVRLIKEAVATKGYVLKVTSLDRGPEDRVLVSVPAGKATHCMASYKGFEMPIELRRGQLLADLRSIFGDHPESIQVFDGGRTSDAVVAEARAQGLEVQVLRGYPERV